ncbi:MAG: hypothetical protein WC661_11850 [Opitutaceae bacterium]
MSTVPRDANGQPIYRFPAALINNQGKAIDQLIGLCRGILIDGVVADQEAAVFRTWVETYFDREPVFPFDLLKKRLDAIFADGVIDDVEREELAGIMQSLGGLSANEEGIEDLSASLPITQPAPAISYAGAEFVVTGRCAYGTRAKVWDVITARGGVVHEQPRFETRYVLIGHFASRDWVHTSYGRKIERAVELRDSGHDLYIISEAHWTDSLKSLT